MEPGDDAARDGHEEEREDRRGVGGELALLELQAFLQEARRLESGDEQGDENGERADQAFMSYSLDGKNWTDVDAVLQMSFSLDYFTGYRTGLYSYATESAGGYADFDYFRQIAQ